MVDEDTETLEGTITDVQKAECSTEQSAPVKTFGYRASDKDFFDKMFDWVGSRYYRVVAFNLMAVALFGAISYGIGKPIWKHAKAINEARLEQKINKYESMKRHKVQGRPILAIYNDCIMQNKNWSVEEIAENKEAYSAAFKKINNKKPDNNTVSDTEWPYSPCNNPAHASEQEPAPQK